MPEIKHILKKKNKDEELVAVKILKIIFQSWSIFAHWFEGRGKNMV